jgi:hypothetical protein
MPSDKVRSGKKPPSALQQDRALATDQAGEPNPLSLAEMIRSQRKSRFYLYAM